MALYIVEKLVNSITILDLHGRLVLGEETEAIRKRVKRLVAKGQTRVVMDLAELEYIDSSGLSTLISCFVSMRNQGGELKLVNLTRRVRDVMQITKLSTVFDVYDSFEDAEKSFAKPAGA